MGRRLNQRKKLAHYYVVEHDDRGVATRRHGPCYSQIEAIGLISRLSRGQPPKWPVWTVNE